MAKLSVVFILCTLMVQGQGQPADDNRKFYKNLEAMAAFSILVRSEDEYALEAYKNSMNERQRELVDQVAKDFLYLYLAVDDGDLLQFAVWRLFGRGEHRDMIEELADRLTGPDMLEPSVAKDIKTQTYIIHKTRKIAKFVLRAKVDKEYKKMSKWFTRGANKFACSYKDLYKRFYEEIKSLGEFGYEPVWKFYTEFVYRNPKKIIRMSKLLQIIDHFITSHRLQKPKKTQ